MIKIKGGCLLFYAECSMLDCTASLVVCDGLVKQCAALLGIPRRAWERLPLRRPACHVYVHIAQRHLFNTYTKCHMHTRCFTFPYATYQQMCAHYFIYIYLHTIILAISLVRSRR